MTFFDYQSAVRMVRSPTLTVGIWNANRSISGCTAAFLMVLLPAWKMLQSFRNLPENPPKTTISSAVIYTTPAPWRSAN